jgi:hypothetical protein
MNTKDRCRVYLIGSAILIVLCACTVTITLSILTYQMLWGQSPEYDGTFVRDHGSMLGSLMITAQITFLNLLYGRLAAYLTDVENQRTEVAYEDSLIVKVAARPVLVLAMLLPECKSVNKQCTDLFCARAGTDLPVLQQLLCSLLYRLHQEPGLLDFRLIW